MTEGKKLWTTELNEVNEDSRDILGFTEHFVQASSHLTFRTILWAKWSSLYSQGNQGSS